MRVSRVFREPNYFLECVVPHSSSFYSEESLKDDSKMSIKGFELTNSWILWGLRNLFFLKKKIYSREY